MNTELNDQQIIQIARTPLLVVYGDHLSAPTGIAGPGWQDRKEGCDQLISRLRQHGGHADMLYLPSIGILGNSHMIMQDRNNLAVADLILKWLDKEQAGK